MRKRRHRKKEYTPSAYSIVDCNALITELRAHIYTYAVITMSNPMASPIYFDVIKNARGNIVFLNAHNCPECGKDKRDNKLDALTDKADMFFFQLIRLLHKYPGAGMILRSFTNRQHLLSNWPISELRGYGVFIGENKAIEFRKISRAELFRACNTDSKTGEPLTPETAVEYCDDATEIQTNEE